MSEWTAEPDIVVSASQWAINTVSKLFHCLSSPKQLVIAVAMGTRILFYGIQDIQNTIHWEVLYTMHTSYESIQKISCGPNILALVSNDNILTIWMGMRSGVAPILVQTFKFDEPIQDIVWNVTSDAQFLLAVAFPRSIGIFGQKRASISCPQDDLWVCYTKFDVDTPEDITALTWVDCGVLIVAAGNQLRCYLKWLTQEDRVVKMHKTINNKLEPMSSVFDISYEVNGPLPFYHPEHLIHYIMWNKMDLVNATLGSLYHFLKQFVDEEDHTIQEFPPVSFPQILELQNGNAKKGHPSKQRYDLLFGDDEEHSNVDSDDDARPLTDNEVKNLIYQLKSRSLPGLNETEKMHLIALVDTIVELNQHGGSLDENGVRFTALLENHFHLKEILPSRGNQDLQPKDYIWALHSQSQDLLLEKCRHLHDNKLVWENARSLGIFMWLQKIDVVRDQMMAIARNIYLSKAYDRDPVDCTLFYFALRKKTIVQGLWKTTSHHKEKAAMIKFLANDFSDPRWQRAASKNAFALLGKQRFEYAAAFFLLADKLKDAVNVILKHVKDYQLAIALCRVYEGDHSPLLQDIIRGSVIPEAIINKDPWLASVSYWLLNEKQESIRAIVAIGSPSDDSLNEESVAIVYEPSLFIMYLYLKNMLKQEFVSYSAEYLFSLFVSQSYERLGCPLLALYILTRYRMKKPEQDKPNKECATDLFANENTKPSYSADLFADEPTQPSYATGLFADEPVKPSYSTDLFADEPAKPSYSTDLFADEPSKSSNDLFSDDDWLIGKKESSAGSFSDEDDRSNSDSSEDENTENDGLDGYKALLVVRMPQTFFHGASVLYNGLTEPDNFHETQYRSFFLKNRDALLKLGETLSIPASVFSRLLMEKSIETDVFPLYLYILNEGVPKDFDVHQFLRAFKVGCFETFNIWSQLRSLYCNPETAASTTRTIALTTYISLALVTLKERHYENCWILVYKFKGFIETLASTERGALSHCISQLLVDDTKMVEMASNDFDSFSDESMFGFDMNEEVYRPLIDAEDHSVAANLLEIASLNYILSCIETAMQNLRKNNSELGEYLTEFIWTTLLDPIAYRTYCLKEIIIQQLENNLDRRNLI
ncbi:RAVE protein 1 C terminal-domain-containing protein [Pilobolus umbonatus]|nr:RAVE protein 1 C terminal-domain-containing protein [Pilobolus umbonatus]